MRPFSIIRTVVVLNVIVTVAAMAMVYRALSRADDSERLVIRSHQTLRATEETLRQLVDAESWERVYVLTRSQDDFAAFNRARDTVGGPLDNLGAVLREEGRADDAQRLRAQVADTLAAFDRLVELARTSATVDPATRATARANIEAVRTTTREIGQIENDRLNARLQEDASAGQWVNWLAMIMTGLATALLTTLLALVLFLARPGIWRVR